MPAFNLLFSFCGEECFYLTTPPTSSSPSHCPRTLLCQSYRGVEWAWSSSNASEVTLGGFRLHFSTAVRVYSSSLQPRHPLSPTVANHQFLISSCQSSSSLSPGHSHLDIIGRSLPPKISIVCRVCQPSTSHPNSPPNSAADISCHTTPESSAYGLCEVNGELHISFSLAFRVGPAQGVQGTRHASHSQRHSFSTMWSLDAECAGFLLEKTDANGYKWLRPSRQTNIFERSLLRLLQTSTSRQDPSLLH